MRDPIDPLFDWLGIEGSSVLLTFIFVSMVCQLIARLIPDDATGWKGTVRKVCGWIGLYASSRITAGITVKDVAREVVKVDQHKVSQEIEERVDERIHDTMDELELTDDMRFKPPFPGLSRPFNQETGKFE